MKINKIHVNLYDLIFTKCGFQNGPQRLKLKYLHRIKRKGKIYVVGQNEIQVKMILTLFDSQFSLSSNPNYSWSMNN